MFLFGLVAFLGFDDDLPDSDRRHLNGTDGNEDQSMRGPGSVPADMPIFDSSAAGYRPSNPALTHAFARASNLAGLDETRHSLGLKYLDAGFLSIRI